MRTPSQRMLTYLLITRTRKNDPLPICHAALDVDLLSRLLLDSFVSFTLFTPTDNVGNSCR